MKRVGSLLIFAAVLFEAGLLHAATVKVPEDLGTIRQAFEKVAAGDTILVGPGVYRDSLLFVTKPITLIGTEGFTKTSLVASKGAVLTIDGVRGVTIRGLTLDGGGEGDYGLRCRDSEVRIESCRLRRFDMSGAYLLKSELDMRSCFITGCRSGVYLASTEDATIAKCLMAGNGVGVYIVGSSPVIKNSRFRKNDIGVEVRGASEPVIGGSLADGNVFQRTNRYGFHVRNLGDNEIDCTYNYWYGGDFCEFKKYIFGPVDYVPYANKTLEEAYDECP